jgi:hypothetical protein
VMSPDCPSVPGDTSLAEFVEHFLLRSGRRCYEVGDTPCFTQLNLKTGLETSF